jgi:hypothetical protein
MTILILDEAECLDDEESMQIALTASEVRELLRVAPALKRRQIIFGICSEIREENLFGHEAGPIQKSARAFTAASRSRWSNSERRG